MEEEVEYVQENPRTLRGADRSFKTQDNAAERRKP